MRADRVQAAVQAVVAHGLLPADARTDDADPRPWPVIVLMAFGAWLAALPMLGLLALLLGGLLDHGPVLHLVGGALLALGAVVLRAQGVALFIEQMAVPVLLSGLLGLAAAFLRDLPERGGHAATLALVLGCGALLPRAWLRLPLGAAAAGLAALMLTGSVGQILGGGPAAARLHWAWPLVLILSLAALHTVSAGRAGPPRRAAAVDALASGALLGALAGLAAASGMSFLVGGATGAGAVADIGRELARLPRGVDLGPAKVLSVLTAVAALVLLARAWPSMRRPHWALAALVPLALSAFVPALGPALLAAAGCAVMHRFRLAAASVAVALWGVGGFYYAAALPLTQKALLLCAAGAWLAACAGWIRPPADARTGPRIGPPTGRRWWGACTCGVAALLIVNAGIWRNETLIRQGRPVLVEIVPVDPRSLLQGDYMRLAFRLPADLPATLPLDAHRPRILLAVDERGVARPLRLARPGEAPGAGQLLMELTPRDGRWTLVTDAWHFREGDGARWARARYGEFRVQADGRALLVGLRDEGLGAMGW
ncbi:MAG: hypothetical protein RLY78_1331 [Pseudomonadota bacterium]